MRSSFVAGSSLPYDVLAAHLNNGARAVVLTTSDPDMFVGWAAVTANGEVIWTYVKSGAARGRGFATALLRHLGVDTSKTVVALYDSPALQALIRRGKPIFLATQKAA